MKPAAERPGPRFLTVQETAELLRLHRQTVYTMASRGQLPAVRIGRALRIHAGKLERMLEDQAAGHEGGGR